MSKVLLALKKPKVDYKSQQEKWFIYGEEDFFVGLTDFYTVGHKQAMMIPNADIDYIDKRPAPPTEEEFGSDVWSLE